MKRTKSLIILNVLIVVSLFSQVPEYYSDQWVATDALGRTLPSSNTTGPKRSNRIVGVFYYIWHGAHGNTVYDITKILKQYPSDPLSSSNPGWGPQNSFHLWGEPEAGYYRAEDPWVIRRNLYMLSAAQVDFVFFDVTNAVTYLSTVSTFCSVSAQMRSEGIPTPDFAFLTHSKSGATANTLYDQFYSQNKYPDQWFSWAGKPLLFGDITDTAMHTAVKNFFTIKQCWVGQPNAIKDENHWPWLCWYPQGWGWSGSTSNKEQVSVSVAFHPANPQGKSYHSGAQPTVNSDYLTANTDEGLHFAEQWSRALSVDPQVIMITQWNEWIAQRFLWSGGNGTYAGRPIVDGKTHFVDVFTAEFNRDIEPMKGGYTDNYYYQMISNIRKYKGMNAPQSASAAKTITMDGSFGDWNGVLPVYWDPNGDCAHRNSPGYDPNVTLVNNTGRNDIIESRVAFDGSYVFFYVKTAVDLTAHTSSNWMLLYIDTDMNKSTGWEGYDYVVNMGVTSSTQTTCKAWSGGSWVSPVACDYRVNGAEMEIRVPLAVIGQTLNKAFFCFHWNDNPLALNDISQFFINGESAPDRRFNYSYTNVSTHTAYNGPHSIPGTNEAENIYNGGEGTLFPNPASGLITVATKFPCSEIDIIDLQGRIMYHDNKPFIGFKTIDVSGFDSGVYIVRLRLGNNKYFNKVLYKLIGN